MPRGSMAHRRQLEGGHQIRDKLTSFDGPSGSVRWDQLQETAEDLMKKAILSCPWVCAAVSPLGETIMVPRSPHAAAEFVVVWDAMDGTSNLHAGVNTGPFFPSFHAFFMPCASSLSTSSDGADFTLEKSLKFYSGMPLDAATIFGIYRRLSPAGSEPELRDALQPPSQLLCAGYAMYAAGTRLILASETGADCYVLDDDLGHFVLSAKRIRIPERGSAYSVNEGNSAYWDEPTRSIVAKVKLASQPPGSSEKIRLRYAQQAPPRRTQTPLPHVLALLSAGTSGRWSPTCTGRCCTVGCSCTLPTRDRPPANYGFSTRRARLPTSSPRRAGSARQGPRASCLRSRSRSTSARLSSLGAARL